MTNLEQTPEQDPLGLEQPAQSKRRWLSLLGRMAISVGALAWLAYTTNWARLGDILATAKLEFCVLSLVTYCACQMVSSVRWQLMARSVGLREVWRRFIALYFVGMFFNLFLPTSMGGDLARAWYLADGKGKRLAAALSVFSERLTGLMALLILASVATIPNWGTLPDWSLWFVYLATVAGFTGLATLPFLAKWSGKARKLAEALSICRGQRGRWLAALGLSFGVQALSVVMLFFLGVALDVPLPWTAYAVVMPLVSLFTMILPTLNGFGVREGSLVLLLAPAGLGQDEALALGLLWSGVLVAASVLGGGVYLLGGYRRIGKDANGPERRNPHQGRMRELAAPVRAARPALDAARPGV